MLSVQNMISNRSGRAVANQFIIFDDDKRVMTFQSYASPIVTIDRLNETITIHHDWDFSKTTAKYRNQFMSIYFPRLSSADAIRAALEVGKIDVPMGTYSVIAA